MISKRKNKLLGRRGCVENNVENNMCKEQNILTCAEDRATLTPSDPSAVQGSHPTGRGFAYTDEIPASPGGIVIPRRIKDIYEKPSLSYIICANEASFKFHLNIIRAQKEWEWEEIKFRKYQAAIIREKNIKFELQNGWLAVINEIDRIYKIDWWVTLTFGNQPGAGGFEYAYKALRRWLHTLNRWIFGAKYYKRGQGVIGVCAWERQDRGIWHFHLLLALLGGAKKVRRMQAVDLWWKRFKYGIAEIYDYEPGRGADAYCSKYVSDPYKQGELEIIGSPTGLFGLV